MIALYRPSNGSEGRAFMAQWCARCVLDADAEAGEGCEILSRTMVFQVGDAEYPADWREDGRSGPRCTAFSSIDGTEPLDPAAAIGLLL